MVRRALRPETPPSLLDWELAVALLTYAAASVADYLLTLAGLLGKEVRELNPLIQAYIDHLGAPWGLFVPKVLLGLTVVGAASFYLHAMHLRRRTRIRPQHLLYPGALFTALAPAHWVVLKFLMTRGGP